ncbi:MAG: 2,4-dihydroxyhept-2-ene-1,7-dioic acid aldolase [Actinobacteria bacterium]|nr:2,4-dihydroxyhept-2-ene-1,7-dioic acid aldolase [Actinomycetota bacterium]
MVTEICAQAIDWVAIDLEHGADAELLGLVQAADCGGAFSVVRVPALGSSAVGRALDAGADGVMFPWIDTAEQAKAAVAQTRFGPEGQRGFSPIARAYGYSRNVAAGLSEPPLVIAQIESAAAVDAAASIAAIEGIDVLFVGPGDLGRDLSRVSSDVPTLLEKAIDGVIAGANAAGKVAGLLVEDVASARTWISRGAAFVAIGGDIGYVIAATDGIGSLAKRRA